MTRDSLYWMIAAGLLLLVVLLIAQASTNLHKTRLELQAARAAKEAAETLAASVKRRVEVDEEIDAHRIEAAEELELQRLRTMASRWGR